MTSFYLGSPEPSWAWNGKARGSLFISANRFRRRRTLFPAAVLPAGASIAIDSGGYTELLRHGRWTTSPADYVALVRRVAAELGRVAWAAPQDWMCEPWMLVGGRGAPGTGLTVAQHQRLTIESVLELRALAPEIRWIPVLQGQTLGHYLGHVEDYDRAGIDLRAEELVGVGSVCRRNRTDDVGEILHALFELGLQLHGFGVKAEGLARFACWLASADSMAWSFRGRVISREESDPPPELLELFEALDLAGYDVVGCHEVGRRLESLANSQGFAEEWRARMDEAIASCRPPIGGRQLALLN